MRTQQNYEVGIYCRLSVDDGSNNESMSIGNQRQILTEYADKQGWNIRNVYIDDGFSGVSFDRPNFKRMIDDVESGIINLIIVKDLSRLGRNYILCGQYTEIYFPEKNVRFIALNDGIDTLYSNNDIAPFKNILNDMYAKDISVKIKSALHAKARRGEYLGACDPYGYLRDPQDKHRLVINPEVAPNVMRMFELCVSGYGLHRIAKILNKDGVLSPADYDRFRKHNAADGEFAPKYTWSMGVVRNIVKNPMFIGHMVQCRKRSQSYRTQKIVLNSKEDWVIVENTHEPIVSKELFNKTQKVIEGRTRFIKQTGEPHIFTNLFFCAECGRKMAHHKRDISTGNYYSCGKYRALGPDGCSSHHISYDNIYGVVLRDIQNNVQLLQEDEQKALKDIMAIKFSEEQKRLKNAKKELTTAQRKLPELEAKIKRVYEDNISGKLPDNLFATFLADYQAEKTTLQERIRTLQNDVVQLENTQKDVSQFVKLIKQYTDISTLNRQNLNELIDKITISETPQPHSRNKDFIITIYYKFVGKLN